MLAHQRFKTQQIHQRGVLAQKERRAKHTRDQRRFRRPHHRQNGSSGGRGNRGQCDWPTPIGDDVDRISDGGVIGHQISQQWVAQTITDKQHHPVHIGQRTAPLSRV